MQSSLTTKAEQVRSLCGAGRWADALTLAQQWQTESPTDARAFYYEGVALTGLGRFIAAETAYQRALGLDNLDFKTWHELALLLFGSLNQPVEAAKCLAQAMQIDPGNKLGWANLASIYARLGRPAQALDCADRAVALDPEMVEAQLQRARAAQALGKPEIVRTASEALARLSPEKFKRAS